MLKDTVFGTILLIVVSVSMLTMTAKATAYLSVSISPSPPIVTIKSTSKLFTATVAGGAPPYQYAWTLLDNLKVPVAHGTGNPWNCTVPKYAFVGAGEVQVIVNDLQGLLGFANESVLILSLFVSVSPSAIVMDVGQSQVFNSSVLGGTTPISYQWYLDGNLMPGATSASWTYTPSSAGFFGVYVKVTDAAGLAVTSNAVPVIVNAALSVSISCTPGTLDVGQSKAFNSTVSGGTSPFSYQWYLNGIAVLDATSASWTCTPSSTDSFTVYVIVNDSASAPACAASSTACVTVDPPRSYRRLGTIPL